MSVDLKKWLKWPLLTLFSITKGYIWSSGVHESFTKID